MSRNYQTAGAIAGSGQYTRGDGGEIGRCPIGARLEQRIGSEAAEDAEAAAARGPGGADTVGRVLDDQALRRRDPEPG